MKHVGKIAGSIVGGLGTLVMLFFLGVLPATLLVDDLSDSPLNDPLKANLTDSVEGVDYETVYDKDGVYAVVAFTPNGYEDRVQGVMKSKNSTLLQYGIEAPSRELAFTRFMDDYMRDIDGVYSFALVLECESHPDVKCTDTKAGGEWEAGHKELVDQIIQRVLETGRSRWTPEQAVQFEARTSK